MSPPQLKIVALGSSFAAGPRIEPVENRAAGRSARNYPHLVAEALGAQLTDATVSGATTETILRTPQRAFGTRFPPQIEAVDADTDIVTVTAGGNDLGYLGGIMGTSLGRSLSRHVLTRRFGRRLLAQDRRPTAEMIASATSGLVEICAEVRRRSPEARVILVGYLPIFDPEPNPAVTARFSPDEIDVFREVAQQLADVYAEAARRSGAEIVPAASLEAGHGVGSATPWVNDVQPFPGAGSFHPNAAGMQALADAVLEVIERPRA